MHNAEVSLQPGGGGPLVGGGGGPFVGGGGGDGGPFVGGGGPEPIYLDIQLR